MLSLNIYTLGVNTALHVFLQSHFSNRRISHSGIWSLGFDPKYFGWSGGETLYWRLTNTKVICANFSNLAAILIIFQSTAAVFAKVLARSHKYSLQGDECTEGTKALFSVGEELGYAIYRSGLRIMTLYFP